MGRTNANRAQKAREKNAKRTAAAGKGSQLEQNAQAKNIVCMKCRQSFMCTMKRPQLQEHVTGKHAKTEFKDCFPDFKDDGGAGAKGGKKG